MGLYRHIGWMYFRVDIYHSRDPEVYIYLYRFEYLFFYRRGMTRTPIRHHKRTGREPIQHCFNVSKDDINWKELAFNRTNGAITKAEVDGLKESNFTPCATQNLWS